MKKFVIIICISLLTITAFFNIAIASSTDETINDLKAQIAKKEQEIKAIEEKAKAYKSDIADTQKQQKTLKGHIANINNEIGYLTSQIDVAENKIDYTQLSISKLKLEIKKQEESLRLKKIYIASAIQTIDEYDGTSMIELLLKNKNFSSFLSQEEYMASLEEEIQKNIDTVQLLKDELTNRHDEQTKKELELQELKVDLLSQKTITNKQKSTKENLLLQTKNQEKKYASLLSEIQKKRNDTQKEIYELEEKLKYAIDKATIPEARDGILDWPAKGRISQGYGSTSKTGFINNVYSFHNGIDIASPIGTPIYTAKEGKVVAVGDDGQYAYGKWIAIDHGNGLTTLYGHLSLQSVSTGASVKSGQKIGYMGSTGFSTGSHLHFTVYASNTFYTAQRWYGLLPVGGSINPYNYLGSR